MAKVNDVSVATLPAVGLIYSKIPAVAAEVGAIAKERKNDSQGFYFRGIDDVYNAFHGPMVAHGVFVTTRVSNVSFEERTTAKGSVLTYTRLRLRVRFVAGDGSFVETVTAGEAMDTGDKGTNKAMSIALKYAFFQTFMVPLIDPSYDPDATTHTDILPKAKSAPAPAPAPSLPKTAAPVEKLAPEKVAEIKLKLQTMAVAEIEKFEQAINRHGVIGSVDGAVYSELVFLWISRCMDIVETANLVASVGKRISDYRSRNVLSAEAHSALVAKMEEKCKA